MKQCYVQLMNDVLLTPRVLDMSMILTVDDSRGSRKMIGIAIREFPSVRLLEAALGPD